MDRAPLLHASTVDGGTKWSDKTRSNTIHPTHKPAAVSKLQLKCSLSIRESSRRPTSAAFSITDNPSSIIFNVRTAQQQDSSSRIMTLLPPPHPTRDALGYITVRFSPPQVIVGMWDAKRDTLRIVSRRVNPFMLFHLLFMTKRITEPSHSFIRQTSPTSLSHTHTRTGTHGHTLLLYCLL